MKNAASKQLPMAVREGTVCSVWTKRAREAGAAFLAVRVTFNAQALSCTRGRVDLSSLVAAQYYCNYSTLTLRHCE